MIDNTFNIFADEPGSYCHGSIANGTLTGRIYTKGDAYTLEPAHLYLDNTDYHSVMYSDKHIDKSLLAGSGCGLMGEIQKRMQEKLKKTSNLNKDNVSWFSVSDYQINSNHLLF